MRRRRPRQRRTRSSRRREAGLTLLEVLFAVAILGLGAAVILQGLALGLRVRREAVEIREMSHVAAGALNLLLSRGEAPSAAEEGRQGNYTWRLVPEPPSALGDSPGNDTISVRVTVERPAGSPLEVHTLFPAEADR